MNSTLVSVLNFISKLNDRSLLNTTSKIELVNFNYLVFI